MAMPDGKQRRPEADLSEAIIWYMRSKAKHLPAEEMREFESWLHGSPENAAALLTLAEREHHITARRRSTSKLTQARARLLLMDRPGSQISTEHSAISHDYFRHLKRKYLLPKIGLLAATVCGVAGWMFLLDTRLLKVAAVAFGCFLLVMIREAVVGYRVANGYFGTTESEVRDFIKFITAHRDRIDFTDEGGTRRPGLVPEPQQPGSAASAAPSPTEALSE